MDPVRSLGVVFSGTRVQERAAGGNKQQADAFRKALQRDGGPAPEGEAAPNEPPVRTGLQPRPRESRRDDGTTARHVDVIA